MEQSEYVIFEYKSSEYVGELGNDFDGSKVIWIRIPDHHYCINLDMAQNVRKLEIKY